MSGKAPPEPHPWCLELTESQSARLASVAASLGISVNEYIKWIVQDHAQELIDEDASIRRMDFRTVSSDHPLNCVTDIQSGGPLPSELLQDFRSACTQGRDDSCFAITPKLISGELLTDTQQRMVGQLDEAIAAAAPINSKLTLYRGCAPGEILAGCPYPGFISASTDLFEALRFSRGCLVRFCVPPNAQILAVSPSDGSAATLENKEYLMPRNLTFAEDHWDVDLEEDLKIQVRGDNSARIAFRVPAS